MTLIKSITLLHQYQRQTKQVDVNGHWLEYLEVTRRDIALANKIADWALGRSIDELSDATRRLLLEIYDWVLQQAKASGSTVGDVRFTRRALRESLGWCSTQLAYHLERLCREEYVVRFSGSVGKLCQYQLLYDGRGREGQPHLLKLTEPGSLLNLRIVHLRRLTSRISGLTSRVKAPTSRVPIGLLKTLSAHSLTT